METDLLYNRTLALSIPPFAQPEIRLLNLYRNEAGKDSLAGTLSKHHVGQPSLRYVAISYYWGTDAPIESIKLNGSLTLWLKPNLVTALRQIWRRDASVKLWVDSICLNQTNLDEKKAYVPKMGLIYAGADQTWIWVGCEADQSDLAMDWVASLSTLPVDVNYEEMLISVPTSTWEAVRALMKRPWWTRIWVVQEALRSRHPIVLCSTRATELENFVKLETIRLGYSRLVPGVIALPSQPFSAIMATWKLNREDAGSGTCKLLEWMGITHKFEYTDPYDRFYALLGMSLEGNSDAGSTSAEYDRSKLSESGLLIKMTMHFLQQYRSLLPLKYCWRKTRDLPSWVPDWCTEQSGWVSLTFHQSAGRTDYNACGALEPFTPQYDPAVATGESPPPNTKLLVQGLIIGKIIFSDAAPSFDPSVEQTPEQEAAGRAARLQGVRAKCLDWQSMIHSRNASGAPNPYGSFEDLIEGFWRTLMADRRSDWTGPPTAEFRKHFDAWLNDGTEGNAATYYVPAATRCISRSFIITDEGYLGLAPKETQVGDFVCVLTGGDVPFVLRFDEDEMTQIFVGQSYLHGIMDGDFVVAHMNVEKHYAPLRQFRIR